MRPRSPILWILLAAAVLLGAAAGWRWWHDREEAEAVLAALPPIPDLAAWPPDVAARVRFATAAARRREQPVAALRELALLYHANGRYHEAAQAERGLLALEPRNARWTYLLADAAEKLGDADAQRTFLEKTLQLAPYYPAARIRLADLLLKAGQSGPARAQYERYLALAPREPHARLGLARIALEGGDRDGAVRTLETLVRDHPDFVAAHNLLAEVYATEGDTQRADEQRRRSGATGEGQRIDDPWLRWLYAWSFDPYHVELAGGVDAQTRVLETALPFYEEAVQLSPDDGLAHDALGGLYLQLDRPDAAAAVLERGLERAPQWAALYDTLARALRRQGKVPEAIAILRRGKQAIPSAALLPYDLGGILDDGGKREDALACYREAIRLDPQFAEAHWRLGLGLLAAGRTADARESLGRALDLRPQRADDLYALAQDALGAGKLERAACCLEILIDHSPGMPVRDLVQRGLALARQANDAAASAEFTRLLGRPLP